MRRCATSFTRAVGCRISVVSSITPRAVPHTRRTVGVTHGHSRPIGRRTVGHPQDRRAVGSVRRADVLHQLPRPHRDLIRRSQRHERGSRPDRGAVRPGVRRLLHRLHPAGDPQQYRAAQIRRAQMAGPHHGVVGHRVAAVHVRAERRRALRAARDPRHRRSRVLPRRDPVPVACGCPPGIAAGCWLCSTWRSR